MTTRQVAERLGLKPATVEGYCRAGVAGVQKQRRWFLDRKAERAITEHRKTLHIGRPRKLKPEGEGK